MDTVGLDPLSYYAGQSDMTDPGAMSERLAGLPGDLASLQRVARDLVIDAELGDDHADPNDGARVDPLDVPRDRFLVAGRAWQLCRRGEADPETFLVAPELDIPDTRSWPYLRHNVVHDLAALNKVEMILWDDWGLTEEPDLDRDLELLDRVAAATAAADPDLSELRRLYETEPGLRVPAAVTSYSPVVGGPREVALRASAA